MKILVINGPNLNMLGKRDPDKYGRITLGEIIDGMGKKGKKINCEVVFFQSNHEGEIIDFLQKDSSRQSDGLIINPGALVRYAYSLRQALVDFNKPFFEVHMSDIDKTGVNRRINVLDDVSNRVEKITGLREEGYFVAFTKLVNFIRKKRGKNIILIGMKASGKSTVGKLVARKLGIDFIEIDREIEDAHFVEKKERLNFRNVFKKYGESYFRSLESKVLKNIAQIKGRTRFVLACGGGTPLNSDNEKLLRQLGDIVYMDVYKEILLERLIKGGRPAFLKKSDIGEESLAKLIEKRQPIYEKIAKKTIKITNEKPEEVADKIINWV